MNKGDVVKIKPNFHRPSRIGQLARIVAIRKVGIKNVANQYFVVFDKDKQPDWIDERDLELVEPIMDQIAQEGLVDIPIVVQQNLFEEPQKRYLDL